MSRLWTPAATNDGPSARTRSRCPSWCSRPRWLAGGPGGGVDADDFVHRRREQAVGIAVAHILLVGERQFLKVFQSLDIIRSDAGFGKRRLVKRNIRVHPRQGMFQSRELKRFQRLPRECLDSSLYIMTKPHKEWL